MSKRLIGRTTAVPTRHLAGLTAAAPASLVLLLVQPAHARIVTQTAWDSPGEALPARDWGGGFASSFSIDWQSTPGRITLDRLGCLMGMGSMGVPVSSIRCGDIDGDGDCDIAASGLESRVVWYENGGGGLGFILHSVLPAAGGPGHPGIVLLDSDGDGDLDIAGSSGASGEVVLYENCGYDLWPGSPIAHARGTIVLDAADMDADGDPDLLAGFGEDSSVAWLENTGPGSDWSIHQISGETPGASAVDAGDVDGDGDIDIAVSCASGEVLLLRREGGSWRAESLLQSAGVAGVEIAGIGSGSTPPLVVRLEAEDLLAVLESTPGGWTVADSCEGLVSPGSSGVSDLDGDGDLDIFAVSQPAGELAWWENLGARGLAPRHAGSSSGLSACDAGDIDGDGADEIVTGTSEGSVGWWEQAQYSSSGSLTSSILFLEGGSRSGIVEWESDTPPGTAVRVTVRASGNRFAMGDWTEVARSGASIDTVLGDGRAFIQYRIELSTTDPDVTPSVESFSISVP